MNTRTLTPEEKLWQSLLDEVGEELVEAAAAVSVDQAKKELAAAGFDVAQEEARAEAFLRSLEDGTFGQQAEAPMAFVAAAGTMRGAIGNATGGARRMRSPVSVWVATAVAAAAAAVGFFEAHPPEALVTQPDTPPSATASSASPGVPSPRALAMAADLRRRAREACDSFRPDACLALLDEAATHDPAGDGAPEVQALREVAATQLEPQPK